MFIIRILVYIWIFIDNISEVHRNINAITISWKFKMKLKWTTIIKKEPPGWKTFFDCEIVSPIAQCWFVSCLFRTTFICPYYKLFTSFSARNATQYDICFRTNTLGNDWKSFIASAYKHQSVILLYNPIG